MVSAPLGAVTPPGGCVPSGGPVLALVLDGGAWDLERSSFLSRWASPPVAGLFKEVPRLPGRTPDPENHSPDLVRISCCLRHWLHTHITCSHGYRISPHFNSTKKTGFISLRIYNPAGFHRREETQWSFVLRRRALAQSENKTPLGPLESPKMLALLDRQ